MKNSGSELGQRDVNPKPRINGEAKGGEGHDDTTGPALTDFIQCMSDWLYRYRIPSIPSRRLHNVMLLGMRSC